MKNKIETIEEASKFLDNIRYGYTIQFASSMIEAKSADTDLNHYFQKTEYKILIVKVNINDEFLSNMTLLLENIKFNVFSVLPIESKLDYMELSMQEVTNSGLTSKM